MNIKTILSMTMALVVVAAGGVYAQSKTSASTAVPTSNTATVYVRPFCKFGLQFLASSVSKPNNENGSGGTSMVQVTAHDGKPLACAEDVK